MLSLCAAPWRALYRETYKNTASFNRTQAIKRVLDLQETTKNNMHFHKYISDLFSQLKNRKHSDSGVGSKQRVDAESDVDNRKFDSSEQLPSFLNVPKHLARVPLLVVYDAPIFPGFMKVLDIRSAIIIESLRERIDHKQPFVGVFLKRLNDDNDYVTRMDQLHHVGCFCKIHDVQDHEHMLRLSVVAYRRVRIVGSVIDESYPEIPALPCTPLQARHLRQQKQLGGRRPRLEGPIIHSRMPAYWLRQWQRDELLRDGPMPVLAVEIINWLHEPYDPQGEVATLTKALLKLLHEVLALNPQYKKTMKHLLQKSLHPQADPVFLCDLAASISLGDALAQQRILEHRYIKQRLLVAKRLLKQDLQLARMQRQLGDEAEQQFTLAHRKKILFEQGRRIELELGLTDNQNQRVKNRLLQQLCNKQVPAHIQLVIDGELRKLSFLALHSIEYYLTLNYLEWLTSMPWGLSSKENLDLELVARLMDAEHYGIQEVKTRILEFIAVSTLRGTTQGGILCLHGASGVGKTSIARTIARALNRPYYRICVGGLTDVAEIKGHRRSYVGAMPGKLIQCLKQTGSENPLILIDEIDKLGCAHFRGDASDALLEALDSAQHSKFSDNYMEVPVDLSRVLFICTANVLAAIPAELRDRMDMLEVSGYTAEEKVLIARKFLIPQAIKDAGLPEQQICITDDALEKLADSYCRESGVRNLQRHIEKIARKVAYRMLCQNEIYLIVNAAKLPELLGSSNFNIERFYFGTPIGVALGFAWSTLGGAPVYIETARHTLLKNDYAANESAFHLTGSMGPIMQESADIALTVARHVLAKQQPKNKFLEVTHVHIHLHMPEGAELNDGAGTGVTIVTALLSLGMGRAVRSQLAMVGEITLRGKVLAVGSIKEKIIAAKRYNVAYLVLPEANRADYMELPEFITKDLAICFVNNYEQIYKLAFGYDPLPKPAT